MDDRSAAGFTLVELLVALVIFAFIVAMSFDAVRFSGAAWDNVSSKAIAIDEETSVLRFLRARLEGISIPVVPDPEQGESVQWWLEGTSDEITFVASWYRGAVPGRLYKLRLWRDGRGATGTLNLAWEPYLPGEPDPGREGLSGERILVEGIAAISLRYFGADDADERLTWRRAWSNVSVPPALVEIVITSESTGENWTRLVVATGH
jgi:prepilin-type N-terminal cleavage/methylation domain-containing protein